jgi:hypothetical protein
MFINNLHNSDVLNKLLSTLLIGPTFKIIVQGFNTKNNSNSSWQE